MRVFLTGATGFVGSALVRELLTTGHRVLGLTRSDAGAKTLAAAGAEVLRGTLEDLDCLKRGAAASDGVIHTAFVHDFSNFAASCETDRRAITAIGETLKGSDRPFLITSGTAAAGVQGRIVTEEDAGAPDSFPRLPAEYLTIAMASEGVRTGIIRLPPSVHDQGDHGFVPHLINIARTQGVSAYIGDGLNRWPAVHRLDAVRVYTLALEKGTPGSRFHAVGDEGIPTKVIAETIGRHLDLPVVSKSPAEAAEHFGWIGHFFAFDVPASAQWTQKTLDWKPTHPGLIADLDAGHYFQLP